MADLMPPPVEWEPVDSRSVKFFFYGVDVPAFNRSELLELMRDTEEAYMLMRGYERRPNTRVVDVRKGDAFVVQHEIEVVSSLMSEGRAMYCIQMQSGTELILHADTDVLLYRVPTDDEADAAPA